MKNHVDKFSIGTIATLCLMVALVLASCGSSSGSSGSSGQKAPTDQQVFNWPMVGINDIKTFDPAMAITQTSIQPIMMVFTGLVATDDNLKVVPQLAQSWQQSSDSLTWTFTLKDNLKFSDGTPLTSKDVAYSIDRALSPDLASGVAASYLNLIKDYDKRASGKISTLIGDSLNTPDDKTISIIANKPVAYFLQTLVFNTSFVVEKSMIDKYGQTKWTDHLSEGGGAGPFKVQTYDHSRQIIFVPNENYYGPKPQFSKVVMPFIKDPETAYKNYQLGQIDQVAVPSAHIDEAQKSAEYHKVVTLSTGYLGLNMLSKPFDNANIRRAFAMGINKDVLIQRILKNVDKATNHIVPEGMPGYDQNLKGPDGTTTTAGDPAKAKEFLQKGLQEAGYSGVDKLPEIKLSYPSNSPDQDNLVAAMQQQWKTNLGIDVKASPVDFETLSTQQAQNYGSDALQFFMAIWGADYADPQNFLTLQFGNGSPQNQTNYGQNKSTEASAQQAVQQKMDQADVEKDENTRMSMYNDAEQQIVNDVGWLPLYQLARSRMLKSYVQGRTFNAADNFPPDSWANQYITSH